MGCLSLFAQNRTKTAMIFLFFLKESFVFAFNSLVVNKLRTILSLLGITIGIFAIISVFTAIDSMEDHIRESIQTLGDNVVYVQKWPWSFGPDYPWWEYMRRPVPDLDDLEAIERRSDLTHAAAFQIFTSKTIQYKENYAENVSIMATSHAYENIRVFEMARGRYFSPFESQTGKNRAILGAEIAEQLFRNTDPVGKEVKIMGRKVLIIGVFKREGEDMFGVSNDERVVIPLNFARYIINIRNERLGPMIMVKAKEGVQTQELMAELRGIIRAIRRLKPLEEDNFALNKSSMISQGFGELFKVLDVAGIIIGGFSILVGGFGIANIMFVSVKEQTKIIGIQKALGAKKHFILFQFLSEAVVLSLLGGGLGLLIVFAGAKMVSYSMDMQLALTINNILRGVLISMIVGVVSGFVPAYTAARLDPVKAITSG